MTLTAAAVGTIFLGTTGAAIQASNALFTALFRFVDIESGSRNNDHKNCNYNEINHQDFAPLNAYSLLRSFWVLMHRKTRIAAKTTTAMRPGAKPAPSVPVVISVPIW